MGPLTIELTPKTPTFIGLTLLRISQLPLELPPQNSCECNAKNSDYAVS